MADYLKVDKEMIRIEVSTSHLILKGKFTKDKGIRFTDYFNRDKTKQSFVVLSDVEVIDGHSRQLIERKKFLAVNVEYVVTATELEQEGKTLKAEEF